MPAKVAIGTITGLVVLGAILGPSIYFGLTGKIQNISSSEIIYLLRQKNCEIAILIDLLYWHSAHR